MDNTIDGSTFHDLDISDDNARDASSTHQPPNNTFNTKAAPTLHNKQQTTVTPQLAIQVTDPSRVGDGLNAYFSYRVVTTTSLPQYKQRHFAITRRFRDFDWLHSVLAEACPGTIVPPLPEKHSAQVSTKLLSGVGCSAEWVEERRAQLQRFMQRVASHPLLHRLPVLQTFLEGTDEALEAHKAAHRAAAKATGSTGGSSSATQNGGAAASDGGEKGSSLASSVLDGAKAGLVSLGKSPLKLLVGDAPASFERQEDMACVQMSNYVDALEAQIGAVQGHSRRFIERHRALAGSTGAFGFALSKLAACERQVHPSLADALSATGDASERLATLYEEQSRRELVAFDEPLRDYLRLLAQCKLAINARHGALALLNEAAKSLALKKEKLERLRSSDAGGERASERLSTVKRDVSEAEAVLTLARQEYDTIAARVDGEMARFQSEKLADFKAMVVRLLELQIEYSERVVFEWEGLYPRVSALDDR